MDILDFAGEEGERSLCSETLLIAIIKSAAVEELIEQFTVDGS